MKPHQVEWTDKKISDFWNNLDFLILNDIRVNDYFALTVGKDLIRVVNKLLIIDDKIVMDYGCGMGILTEEIMKKCKPAEVYACDAASESVKETKQRCCRYKNFKDAYVIMDNALPIDDCKFDIIFVTEIVEHLSDDALDFLLKQVHRLLKPGGGSNRYDTERRRLKIRNYGLSRLWMLLPSCTACEIMEWQNTFCTC